MLKLIEIGLEESEREKEKKKKERKIFQEKDGKLSTELSKRENKQRGKPQNSLFLSLSIG